MSQKCTRCGATLKQSAKFCSVCGTTVSEAQAAPTPQTSVTPLKCSNCGKTLKEGTIFCTKCGAGVEQTAAPTPTSPTTNGCPHCGFNKNPEKPNFCINCGKTLTADATPLKETVTEQSTQTVGSTAVSCSACGRENKSGSKFCIYCGGKLTSGAAIETTTPSEEVTSSSVATAAQTTVTPIAVPAKVLASLMARGRQLTLEEEYAKNGTESDELFEELSQAAGDSDFELEEHIDTYINERSELERLEALHEKGEVSDRVHDRLIKEYEEKLERIDEQIEAGVTQLQGYQAQIQLEYAEAKEELETINARLLIGDEDTKVAGKKEKLSEKANRLNYALIACDHILRRESAMRNGPLTRFEVTETTVADSRVINDKPGEVEVIQSEKKPEEPKPDSTDRPAPQPDAEAGKICTQCGRVTASDAKFCIHCAAPL